MKNSYTTKFKDRPSSSYRCNTVSCHNGICGLLIPKAVILCALLPTATSLTNLLVAPPIPSSSSSSSSSLPFHRGESPSILFHKQRSPSSNDQGYKFVHGNKRSARHMSQKYIQLFTDSDKNSDEDEESKSRWLQWMTGGSHAVRGAGDVKMRDPVELGGLPRSDRYASRDWLHNTINLPNSVILRSIQFPVFFMAFWGFGISILYSTLRRKGREELASRLCMPTAPHSLMVSALGLLLVFRTNSAYQRFSEGRKIWEEILSTARDLSRMGKLYEVQLGSSKLRRINRLLAAFPYLLRFRIRPNSIMKKIDDPDFVRDPECSLILYQDHATNDSDAEAAAVATDEETTGISRRKPRELYWVDKRSLPWRLLPSKAMDDCARAQNRPLWVCDRMAKELHSTPDSDRFTARERLAFLGKVDKLSAAISACERIHQTVVPLNYARHALRSLTMWLLSLPFALVKDLGLMTGPALFLMSWMLFGVYEIGYSIEDPFQGTLRLSILCDAIRRDVLGDEIIRNTAFSLDTEMSVNEDRNTDDDDLENDDDDDEEDVSVEIEEIVIDEVGNIADSNSTDGLNGISNFLTPLVVNGAGVVPMMMMDKEKERTMMP